MGSSDSFRFYNFSKKLVHEALPPEIGLVRWDSTSLINRWHCQGLNITIILSFLPI